MSKVLDEKGVKYLIENLKTFYNVKYKVFMPWGNTQYSQEMKTKWVTRWPQNPVLGELMTVYTPVNGAILTQDYMFTGNTTGFKLRENETNTTEINKWFDGPNKAWTPIRPNLGTW